MSLNCVTSNTAKGKRKRTNRPDIRAIIYQTYPAIRATGDPFHTDLTGCWMKQGQQFGRAIATVLIRLTLRQTRLTPTRPRIGNRLIRSRLIFAPDTHSQQFTDLIRPLNPFFYLGVGINDRDRSPFALALNLFGLALAAIFLPTLARRLQDLSNRGGTPLWQAIRSLA